MAELEEAMVYVEFPEFGENSFMNNSKSVVMNDLDSEAPKCVIDGVEFIGHYEINLGTKLFFDTNGSSIGQCTKKLCFRISKIPSK